MRIPSENYNTVGRDEYMLTKGKLEVELLNEYDLEHNKCYMTKSNATESDECEDKNMRKSSRTPNIFRK